MQMFWRSFRGFGNHLANHKAVHSSALEILLNTKMSALNLKLTMFEGVAVYKRNYSVAFLPKNFLVTEGKLRSGELHQSNYTINHLGVCKDTSLRLMATLGSSDPPPDLEQPQRIKFKRLDKTAKHIMNILDKEAVEKVKAEREILEIKPGYIVQLKVEVPENKRRVSILKGIVIARRNAGLNSTFRLRRLVAGVGVESVFPLYSPNIKEMKVLDKKKVRRAKLYYLRERMNPLKK